MPVAEGTLTKDILKSFAEGIASDIGGNIGGLLLGSIFPAGGLPVADLAALCDKIKNIVTAALTADAIANINGSLTGMLDYMKNQYPVDKNDPTKGKKDLTAALLPFQQKLEMDVLGQFTSNADRTQAGFPVYLLAVYSYVAYLQELAMVDPNHDDPWQSGYVQVIKNELNNTHIPWCQTQWATLQANRKAKVTVEQSDKIHFVPKGGLAGLDCFRWTDSATGDKGDKHCGFHGSDAQDNANADCAARQQQMQAQLVSDMGDPDSVIAQWQGVAARPLPLPSKAQIKSFTAKWTGQTLTLAWATTGAASVSLRVVAESLLPEPEEDLNQNLSVAATGTRDFVFRDPDAFQGAFLSCTDVDGFEVQNFATFN